MRHHPNPAINALAAKDSFELSPELKAAFASAQQSEVATHGVEGAAIGRHTHPAVMDQFLRELAEKI